MNTTIVNAARESQKGTPVLTLTVSFSYSCDVLSPALLSSACVTASDLIVAVSFSDEKNADESFSVITARTGEEKPLSVITDLDVSKTVIFLLTPPETDMTEKRLIKSSTVIFSEE